MDLWYPPSQSFRRVNLRNRLISKFVLFVTFFGKLAGQAEIMIRVSSLSIHNASVWSQPPDPDLSLVVLYCFADNKSIWLENCDPHQQKSKPFISGSCRVYSGLYRLRLTQGSNITRHIRLFGM